MDLRWGGEGEREGESCCYSAWAGAWAKMGVGRRKVVGPTGFKGRPTEEGRASHTGVVV